MIGQLPANKHYFTLARLGCHIPVADFEYYRLYYSMQEQVMQHYPHCLECRAKGSLEDMLRNIPADILEPIELHRRLTSLLSASPNAYPNWGNESEEERFKYFH